jgi:hypothetical protein
VASDSEVQLFGGHMQRRFCEPVRMGETGGSNSMVESQPSKLLVAGSIPVSRSIGFKQSHRSSVGRAAVL